MMAKYCKNCGAELEEGMKFCTGCGAQIEQTPQSASTTPPSAQPTTLPPVAPTYPPAKKSKTGLIVGIVAIVVAIVIILLVVFFVFGGGIGGISESSFIGTWNVDMMGYTTYEWTFYSNGSMSMLYDWGDFGDSSITWATWHIENNKFYMGTLTDVDVPFDAGMDVEITDGGNTIELKYTIQSQEVTYYTLTKK